MRSLNRCAAIMSAAHDVPQHAVLRRGTQYYAHLIFDEQFHDRKQYWMQMYHIFCYVWYGQPAHSALSLHITWDDPREDDKVEFEKKIIQQDPPRPADFFRLISESSPDMVGKPRRYVVDWNDLTIMLEYADDDGAEVPLVTDFSVEDLL